MVGFGATSGENPSAVSAWRRRARRLNIQIQLVDQFREGETAVALDRDARVGSDSALAAFARQSISCQDFTGLLRSVPGLAGQLQQPKMVGLEVVVA